jgi:4-hydroxy-2-oxoglutarate aldolase
MRLSGVLAPIPTPFDRADRLDIRRLRRALARWLTRPLAGFVVLGTTGEATLLNELDSDRVVATARDSIPTDRPLIAGTGRESTRASVRATLRAGRLGADAVLVRTPATFKQLMTDDVLIDFYTAVADASPVPVLLYNFPAATGVTLHSFVVSRLSRHPNIAGLKDSSGDVLQVSDFAASTPDGFSVLSGSASTFHTAVSMGATGGILALACVLPDCCARLYELARDRKHEEARALQQQLLPVAKLLASLGPPGIKAAAELEGFDLGRPRAPLTSLPDEAIAELRDALSAIHAQV